MRVHREVTLPKNKVRYTSNNPEGGEGLFAKKDIAPKEILALYNGIKVNISFFHFNISS